MRHPKKSRDRCNRRRDILPLTLSALLGIKSESQREAKTLKVPHRSPTPTIFRPLVWSGNNGHHFPASHPSKRAGRMGVKSLENIGNGRNATKNNYFFLFPSLSSSLGGHYFCPVTPNPFLAIIKWEEFVVVRPTDILKRHREERARWWWKGAALRGNANQILRYGTPILFNKSYVHAKPRLVYFLSVRSSPREKMQQSLFHHLEKLSFPSSTLCTGPRTDASSTGSAFCNSCYIARR